MARPLLDPAIALALALLPSASGLACARTSATVPLELGTTPVLSASATVTRTRKGLRIDVVGRAVVRFDVPGVRVLELDVDLRAPLAVAWAAYNDGPVAPRGYRTLSSGPATLELDLSQCPDWRMESRPALVVFGTGRLVLAGGRVEPAPRDPAEFRTLADRRLFWAPQHIDHLTINTLEPPVLAGSRLPWLPDRLACTALAASTLIAIGCGAGRRRLRLGLALSGGTFLAVAAYDAHFLVRILPAFQADFEPDPEVRIRKNYYVAPQIGALAFLARRELRFDERVGVIGRPVDWFGPQTLCFNLAPRRCVILRQGETEFAGLPGVERMRLDELDALVIAGSDAPLPAGFRRVAGIDASYFVAQRQ